MIMLVIWSVLAVVFIAVAAVGLDNHFKNPAPQKEWDPNSFNGMHVRRPR